jgi:hypothetical protein
MTMATDLVRVFGPGERGIVEVVTQRLQHLGVAAVMLPSDQLVGRW